MSRLDAFRKQAKQLVRWHREGNYSIAGRIRGLPRYRHLIDPEALKLKFPLSEAQEIIAREAGHESWAALKAAVEGEVVATSRTRSSAPNLAPDSATHPAPNRAADSASHSAPHPAPTLRAAVPVVFVSNVSASAEFFRDKLGFAIDFLHGHPAFYGSVARDGVALHLRLVHEPVMANELREKENLLAAFISVANVKALFDELKARDVPFAATLRREPWGGPTFVVRDPDGNWICFCEASG
jgi:catechol 2,3-dioxygenase-like lactoylglutathione lyase family enzyme